MESDPSEGSFTGKIFPMTAIILLTNFDYHSDYSALQITNFICDVNSHFAEARETDTTATLTPENPGFYRVAEAAADLLQNNLK